MSSIEQDVFAEWLIGRFTRYGTDAQNVTREAYAEEREAYAVSGELECRRQPGFRDLLEAAKIMVEITVLMLANPKTTSEQTQYLEGLQSQMTATCKDIFAQMIDSDVPAGSGGKPLGKR